jgi:hypothetical protein
MEKNKPELERNIDQNRIRTDKERTGYFSLKLQCVLLERVMC